MSIGEAQRNLRGAIALAHTQAVFLAGDEHPEAVLVSPARYEALVIALEQIEELEAFDLSIAEEGPNVPL